MLLSVTQKEIILSNENMDVHELALRYSGEYMSFLLAQIAGRQTAKHKTSLIQGISLIFSCICFDLYMRNLNI